jgi:ABC-type nitrate/sulfonate/bicarbonate transport system permease component
MGARRRFALQLVIVASALAVWECASRLGFVDARLLPPPSLVAATMYDLLSNSDLPSQLLVTIGEVLAAFIVACPIGLAIGILIAENGYVGAVIKPFFYFGSSVPKSIFLPIFMLAFGIGFAEKMVFGFFQAVFPLVIASMLAVDAVPAELVRVARAYGATRWQIYLQIQWPAMLPLVIEGVRLGILFAITGVLFAEMTAARSGLGSRIFVWGEDFQIPELMAGIALAAIVGIVANESLRFYERRLGRWRQ